MPTIMDQAPERADALPKATGTARFPADLITPAMLRLQLVFADRPHAHITAIDSSAALAVPGVVAVLTAADVPFNAYGLIENDQPVLCSDTVRCIGDRIALVIAESEHIARVAAALIRVSYRDLPVVTDCAQAAAPDAPRIHAHAAGNLTAAAPIRKGDAHAALAAAACVVHGEFSTSAQEHAYLQPEAGIAYIDDSGRIVVESAGQWLHEDRRQIAAMLQLPEDQVVVRYAAVGGAFGGREDLSVQHILALASWYTRRPTALVWDRAESIRAHHKRHPVRIRSSWGADSSGHLTAVVAEVVADGGAYASTSAEVLKGMALFATGPYAVPHVAVDARVYYTNNLPSGAFRGFGAPQAHFAAEVMAARLAAACGLDPIEFRRRNLYREGDIEPTQQPLPAGVSVRECLEAVVTARRQRPPRPAEPGLRYGWGIACGFKNLGYSFGYPEQSTAEVELAGDSMVRQVTVRCGAADVGQGVHTVLRQIAADTLQVPLSTVTLISDDSSITPNAGSASASRLTLMAGRAVHDAAQAALQQWQAEERPASARVTYRPPATTALDPETTAGRPNSAYGYAAQAVEVAVDQLTGRITVLCVLSAHDVGAVMHRRMLEGQIEGGVAQAIGYTLMEAFVQRDGRIQTPDFSSYLLPTALDVPCEIIPLLLEHADEHGPFGARGVAELPLVPFAGALAAAVHDAVGIWLHDLPMTPDRVLAALGRYDETEQWSFSDGRDGRNRSSFAADDGTDDA
jgi:CO/xanthine dehydrogenase Mo-binding subunit